MAIVIITHDWGVVADIADRAVVMYAGEVVEPADVDTLFAQPRFPYTAALLAADPSSVPGSRLPTLPARPASRSWPSRMPLRRPLRVRSRRCLPAPFLCWRYSGSVTRCIRVDELVPKGRSANDQPIKNRSSTCTTSASASAVDARAPTFFALDGVSLTVHRGRTMGLVGESGSGKSTLANAVLGLTPLQSGTVALPTERTSR